MGQRIKFDASTYAESVKMDRDFEQSVTLPFILSSDNEVVHRLARGNWSNKTHRHWISKFQMGQSEGGPKNPKKEPGYCGKVGRG